MKKLLPFGPFWPRHCQVCRCAEGLWEDWGRDEGGRSKKWPQEKGDKEIWKQTLWRKAENPPTQKWSWTEEESEEMFACSIFFGQNIKRESKNPLSIALENLNGSPAGRLGSIIGSQGGNWRKQSQVADWAKSEALAHHAAEEGGKPHTSLGYRLAHKLILSKVFLTMVIWFKTCK